MKDIYARNLFSSIGQLQKKNGVRFLGRRLHCAVFAMRAVDAAKLFYTGLGLELAREFRLGAEQDSLLRQIHIVF